MKSGRLFIVFKEEIHLQSVVRKIIGEFGKRSAHPDSIEGRQVERLLRGGVPDVEIQKVSLFSDGNGDLHSLFFIILSSSYS